MRLTTFSLASLAVTATTACVGDVGSTRKSNAGSASSDANCAKVDGDVVVRTAADMTSLPKTGCYDIYGKLTLQGAAITSLAGLNGLNTVNELEIDHTSLTAFDTKQAIGLYGGLTVTGNAKLTNLAQLEFETAASAILIDGNPQLATLDPLTLADPALTEVDGDLAITDNAAVAAIALTNLTKVTGTTTISGNAAAKSVDLSALATSGAIEISNNPQLGQLAGFAASEVDGDLAISGNAALTSLGTMSSLYRVTGNLTIDGNAALANLESFTTSIKLIDQSLVVTNNQSLTDLGSLKHLQLVGAITITNNTSLISCRASEIDKCVAHPTASVIANNKSSNCNTQCN